MKAQRQPVSWELWEFTVPGNPMVVSASYYSAGIMMFAQGYPGRTEWIPNGEFLDALAVAATWLNTTVME